MILNDYIVTEVKDFDHYIEIRKTGHDPLIEWKKFWMEIRLRINIQDTFFGMPPLRRNSVLIANQKYYQYCWDQKLHVCEECTIPLNYYSATYVSHILSRGSHPEMAHDPRNSRILCFDCHQKAEHETTHINLKIYQTDLIIIEMLKNEYNKICH